MRGVHNALFISKEGWNNHGIRTAHNMTPAQLFTSGALRLQRAGLVALDFFNNVPEEYGTEDDTIMEEGGDDQGVPIPRSAIHLSHEQLQVLNEHIDPLSESTNFGIDLYLQTLEDLRLITMP